MDKKLILLIVGIVIILVVISALVFTGSDQRVKVGVASFSLPEGYVQGNYNDAGDINITNGVNTIFLKEYSSNDTKKILNSYANVTHQRGNNISFSNFTVGNTTVYKSNIPEDKNNVHYWFNYKGKAYSIYFWDNTPDKDVYVKDLINSVKKSVY